MKFMNGRFWFQNVQILPCLNAEIEILYLSLLIHEPLQDKASECDLKLTAYWFIAEESPGQLFEGLQLTNRLSEFCTQEDWTSINQFLLLKLQGF